MLPRKALDWIWLMVGMILAVFLGQFIAKGGLRDSIMLVALVFVLAWVFLSRQAWWIFLPPFVLFGGVVHIGFKIYFHEIALTLALVAFLPVFAMKTPIQRKLPRYAWLLISFLFIHWATSIVINRMSGLSGTGNIIRVYMQAAWPLIFMVPFYCFGIATRFQKTVLLLMYFTAVLRVSIALVGHFFPYGITFLPFASFVLSGPLAGMSDLRFSGLQLVMLTICYFHLSRRLMSKIFHFLILATAVVLVLMGSGRVAVGMLFLILPLWAILYRKFILAAGVSIALAAGVLTLNAKPNLIYSFPYPMQRTLCVLVMKKVDIDWHGRVEASDEWHRQLTKLAYERWTRSVPSFLLGNHIEGFDDSFYRAGIGMEVRAQIAARIAAYESGLWTVLGSIGLAGLILYLLLFWFLLKDVARELLKARIHSYTHTFYFLAVLMLILWIAFSWIAGGFPSLELFMAVIAKVMYEENRKSSVIPSEPAT